MCCDLDVCQVDYTYENEASRTRSVLDHFIVSENISADVALFECLHEEIRVLMANCLHSGFGDYRAALHVALTSIVVPKAALQCDDWSCEQHTHGIQAYYDNIVKACLDAAKGTVGNRCKRRGNTPLRDSGWKDHVEPHCERAIAVRYVKRHEEQCKANKLAEALAKNRGRDIWNEVQKISGRKTNRVAIVDWMVDDRDIGELFARKTSEVFNAVAYDVDRMDSTLVSLESDIRSQCACSQCYHNYLVSLADVFKAVKSETRKEGRNC
ncbi:hypothetical protein CAPTEDRAFT_192142 [Capitella teleta]|uniref:Uncharacterized protein n=1 Tax=Capitella teleta TaxID=283909 RepID=R7V962_CAPTE|nr:hypothetical protein CAPTEDRAFT_192142 [Capitella teleta]|eukprot:ELU15047.1 hypothetical protein CAPTEDRAFT_192142 [Capitella teleta]